MFHDLMKSEPKHYLHCYSIQQQALIVAAFIASYIIHKSKCKYGYVRGKKIIHDHNVRHTLNLISVPVLLHELLTTIVLLVTNHLAHNLQTFLSYLWYFVSNYKHVPGIKGKLMSSPH